MQWSGMPVTSHESPVTWDSKSLATSHQSLIPIYTWKKSSLSRTLIFVVWWRLRDLNSGHSGYEPLALANWAKPPYGADNQDWTGDLILTKDTLYRLSYISDLTFGCGDRTWTCDLRVMSPTSYRLLHPAILYRSNVLLYSNTLPADKKLL